MWENHLAGRRVCSLSRVRLRGTETKFESNRLSGEDRDRIARDILIGLGARAGIPQRQLARVFKLSRCRIRQIVDRLEGRTMRGNA